MDADRRLKISNKQQCRFYLSHESGMQFGVILQLLALFFRRQNRSFSYQSILFPIFYSFPTITSLCGCGRVFSAIEMQFLQLARIITTPVSIKPVIFSQADSCFHFTFYVDMMPFAGVFVFATRQATLSIVS